jgi:membrane fusion protein (multidrug efflux system)
MTPLSQNNEIRNQRHMRNKSPAGKKRERTRNFLWIGLPCLLLFIVVVLISSRIIERKKLQALDSSAKAESIIPVKIMKVQPGPVTKYIKSSGVIRAWQQAVILSEVMGKVKSISAKVGDLLDPGSPILKIDDELLQYAVEQAKAQVLQLEANMETSISEFERKKSLFQKKVISELEFDLVKAKEKADRAMLDSARAAFKIARRDLRNTLIKSPLRGILAEQTVDIGSNVGVGTKAATVVDITSVKIKLGISEKEIGKIMEGQTVAVETDAYPGEKYAGSVYSVGTMADDFTLTFPVEIVVLNNQGLILKPGMTARISINIGSYPSAIALPQEAVIEENAQSFVWTINSNHAHKVYLSPADIIGSQVVFTEGLDAGRLVIVTGMERLFEGVSVQVTNE